MIFVTLGSQKFQFNRLLEAIDRLMDEHGLAEEVFAQTGGSEYVPRNYGYQAFLDKQMFEQKLDECDLLITHGGSGAIMGAVKRGKRVLAVPRLKRFGEHVDDHQEQLVRQFEESGLICACYDCGKLGEAIAETRSRQFRPYRSNTRHVIQEIKGFLEGIGR